MQYWGNHLNILIALRIEGDGDYIYVARHELAAGTFFMVRRYICEAESKHLLHLKTKQMNFRQ